MDVTVVVATYGGPEWLELAERAVASAEPQARVVQSHGRTLAAARNAGLREVTTPWVVHLDADDELEPGYVDAMADGQADCRVPAVRYVRGGRAHRPYVPRVWRHRHACSAECLPDGNWLVVGAAIRTDIAQRVGWREWPVYEDWCFFLRCHLAGATFEPVPAAIYRAHVRPDSRNRRMPRDERLRWHREIHRAAFPDTVRSAA